ECAGPARALLAGGRAVGHFPDLVAAVGRLGDRPAGPPLADGVVAIDAVGSAHLARPAVEAVAQPVPGGDQQRLRVAGVQGDVDDAGVVIDVEDLVPGLAAVGGLVEAALLVGAVPAAPGADVGDP